MATYSANQTAHDPANYNKNASFVYSDKYTAPVLELLDARPGEKLLDLGCGSGELTDKLRLLVGDDGIVWGTDSNEKMLKKATSTFPALDRHVFQSDAQDLQLPTDLENYFDVVFTNATLHWCKASPAGVLRGVKKALKTKTETGRPGRFVGEFGGFMNCIGVRSQLHQVLKERGHDPAALDPWYFPTTEEYQKLLEEEGFTVDHISLHPRLTPLSTDLYGWLITFARGTFLSAFSDSEAEEILQEVVRRCEPDHRWPSAIGSESNGAGEWAVMYCRLRFAAHV